MPLGPLMENLVKPRNSKMKGTGSGLVALIVQSVGSRVQ